MHSIEYIAEDALIVRFTHNQDNTTTSTIIAQIVFFLRTYHHDKISDLIPAYTTLTIVVKFPHTTPQMLMPVISNFCEKLPEATETQKGKIKTIPCYYGAELAFDLDTIAARHQLSSAEVITLHTQTQYHVYAIGFSPGFPYLGYVDQRIATPRRSTPRTKIPKGAVGIANNQTGIYPQATPGGWNIIGLCPSMLFNPQAQTPESLCMIQTGDTVMFESISKQEYIALGGNLEHG